MTKRPTAGSYSHAGKDLESSRENMEDLCPNTDFDSPRPTLQGVPAVRFDSAEEIAALVQRAKKDGRIITDLEASKKHLTDSYPSVASLLIELERIHREAEAKKQRLAAKKILGKVSFDTPKSAPPDNHKPIHPEELTYPKTPKYTRDLDAIIRDYFGNGDPTKMDTSIILDDLKDDDEIISEIKPEKKNEREDSTLTLPAMDENGVVKTNLDTQIAAIQEYTKKLEEQTGHIVLNQEIQDDIDNLINKLKKMDDETRKETFPRLPLRIRKQILKKLSIEAAKKETMVKASAQKEAPPITMTVTLGKKPHVEIRLADKKKQ